MATKKTTKKKPAPGIKPPFGYGEVLPLKKTHRVVLLDSGVAPEFCRSTNAVAISISEFNPAARDYPIVFATADAGKTYAPIVVLGLADKQNLFVDAAGTWDATAYLPAFVRRYPFCVSTHHVKREQRTEKMVCVASARLDRQGVALFEATGEPTPQWQAMQHLLQEFENDLDATAQMCALLRDLDLYSPFTFQLMQGVAPGLKLQGMHRIDEKKFKALKPARHKALISAGLMGKIYAHIHSLENFARLYHRAVARARAPATPKRNA